MAGALAKDIFVDNCITLPKKDGGQLFLGSVGGLIIGGIVGVYMDGSALNAFMSGFAGMSIIGSLVDGKKIEEKIVECAKESTGTGVAKTIEEKIREIAKAYGVKEDLAVAVAKAESGLNPAAKNVNTDGSIDRGLYQINDKYHPEVSDAVAYETEGATKFFCYAVKQGNLNWWNASKAKWEQYA